MKLIPTVGRRFAISAAFVITIAGTTFQTKADEQFFPLQSYRVGPYAAAVPVFSVVS